MKKRTVYIIAVFVCMFLFSGLNSTHGALLSDVIDAYSLEGSRQGYGASAQNIGCIIALFASFFVVPRFKKPRLLWISALCMGLCALPLSLAGEFGLYLAVIVVMGLAMGLLDTLCSSSVSDCFTGRAASAVMCAMHATFGLAGILFPFLFQWIKSASGFRTVYTVMLFVCLAGIAYVIPACEARAKVTTLDRAEMAKVSPASYLKKRGNVLLLVCQFLFAAYFGGISVWCERFVALDLGSESVGSFMIPVLWCAVAAGRILSAIFVKNVMGYIRVTPLIAGVCLAAAVLIAQPVVSAILIFLSVFISAAMIPMVLTRAGQMSRGNTSVGTTLTFFMVYFGQMVGSPLVGAMPGISTGMYLIAGLCILSGVPAFFIRDEAA